MDVATFEGPLVGRLIPEARTARAIALGGFVLLGSLILWASAKVSVPFWPQMALMKTAGTAQARSSAGCERAMRATARL